MASPDWVRQEFTRLQEHAPDSAGIVVYLRGGRVLGAKAVRAVLGDRVELDESWDGLTRVIVSLDEVTAVSYRVGQAQ